MKNPFLKRLIKEKTEDVVHSSAYAQAQNAKGIGSASTESFSQRFRLEKNRSMVRGYSDSKIVNEAKGNAPKAKKYEVQKNESGALNRGGDMAARRASFTARKNPGISR